LNGEVIDRVVSCECEVIVVLIILIWWLSWFRCPRHT